MLNFHTTFNNLDPFAEQENDEISDEIINNDMNEDEMHNEANNEPIVRNNFPVIIENEISDNELHEKNEHLMKIKEIFLKLSINGLGIQ